MQETDTCEHDFRCVRTEGTFGEIEVSEPLKPGQIALLRNDLTQTERVCPHGSIQCGKCNAPLFGSPSTPTVPVPSAVERLRKLNRPH